jgi:GNAT superfamily N-acetyltransferase
MKTFQIRPLAKDDRDWVAALLKEWWAGPKVIMQGKAYYADKLPGLIIIINNKPAGLITYNTDGDRCEIITMNGLVENKGIGSALVNAVKNIAIQKKCKKIWLTTTNDNTHALRFWQKQGFHITIVRTDIMKEYRKLKPEIPLTGNDGIEIRDEIELEIIL